MRYYHFLQESEKFDLQHIDHYHGQDDFKLSLINDGGRVIAYVTYTTYEDEVYINFIVSKKQGKGYGKQLIKHLQSLYRSK